MIRGMMILEGERQLFFVVRIGCCYGEGRIFSLFCCLNNRAKDLPDPLDLHVSDLRVGRQAGERTD